MNLKLAGSVVCLSVAMMGLNIIECSAAKNDQVVDISISSSYGTAVSNMMKEYGLLEKYLPEGYSVEWHVMTSASDMRDSLVSGELDVVCTSLPTFITAYENGMPLELISFAGSVPIGLYGNNEEYTSLSSFTSTDRIAAKSKGNNGHIAFLIACQEQLQDPMALDNQIVTIQEADALALLQSGDDYQASIFSFPMTIKAQQAGLKEIVNFTDIIQSYGIGSTYFTRQDYYSENAGVIEAIRSAQQEALAMIDEDPEAVAETLSPVFDLDKEYIMDAFRIAPPCSEYAGYDKLAELLHDIGLVEKTPTRFEDMVNYEDIK